MNAVSRILRCRLMENMVKRPEYSKKLGLHGKNVRGGNAMETKEKNAAVPEDRTPEASAQE